MTASVQNSNSAMFILQRALDDFRECTEMTAEEKLVHVEILMDSAWKCLSSMAAQIRFYESAKSNTRAIAARRSDGGDEYISGLDLLALRLPLPNLEQDAVVYGTETTLSILSKALEAVSWPSNGPADRRELALELAEASTPAGNGGRYAVSGLHPISHRERSDC